MVKLRKKTNTEQLREQFQYLSFHVSKWFSVLMIILVGLIIART